MYKKFKPNSSFYALDRKRNHIKCILKSKYFIHSRWNYEESCGCIFFLLIIWKNPQTADLLPAFLKLNVNKELISNCVPLKTCLSQKGEMHRRVCTLCIILGKVHTKLCIHVRRQVYTIRTEIKYVGFRELESNWSQVTVTFNWWLLKYQRT